MSVFTVQSYAKQLDKNIDKMWMQEYSEYPAEYTKIAKISDAKKGDGGRITEAEITGLGLFQPVAEGAAPQHSTPVEGNEVTRRFSKAGLAFQVTKEAIQDGRFGVAEQMGSQLARSSVEYMEQVFWDLFNRGFSTHLAKDGVAIFNGSHTLLNGLRGVTTASNLGTAADLSETSWAEAMEYFGTLVDERGMPIPAEKAKYLIHHPNDTYAADRLHTQQYGGAYKAGGLGTGDMSINSANPKDGLGKRMGNGAWTPFMSRWLTDDDAWFAVSPQADFRIVWKQRASLEKITDPYTGNKIYQSILRMSAFCNEWRFGFGNQGAA